MSIEEISKKDMKELISKNWMTHDAIWLSSCIEKVGIEKANEINRASSFKMATVEIKRIMELLGLSKKDTFEDIKKIIKAGIEIIKPDFMEFTVTFPEENLIRWDWKENKCFAFTGMKRMGLIEQYKCGVFERFKGWLVGLDIKFEMAPDIDNCVMIEDGSCSRDFRIFL